MPNIHPQARRFQQQLRALADQVFAVAGRIVVHAHRIGDVPYNVVLRRTCQKVPAALPSGDRAPGIQRALPMAQQAGIFPCRVQRAVAVPQKLARELWHGEGKERHHVHFRIPEVVPFIPFARQTLGRNAA